MTHDELDEMITKLEREQQAIDDALDALAERNDTMDRRLYALFQAVMVLQRLQRTYEEKGDA